MKKDITNLVCNVTQSTINQCLESTRLAQIAKWVICELKKRTNLCVGCTPGIAYKGNQHMSSGSNNNNCEPFLL